MKDGFLESVANLNSGDFKGIFLGNPLGQDDPLDKVSEPKGGWDSIQEPEKTTVWDNRWINGRTINLVGTDSPNFDFPQNEPPRYPYLINQKSIDSVVAFYGKDSLQYYSQCKGVRKSHLYARRVITRELCEQFGAFDDVVWIEETKKIGGCDAAYGAAGGDRCVCGHIEYGMTAQNKLVIKVHPPVIVPVSIKRPQKAEDQISEFVMDYCKANEIPPENFFFDATGRGSLGTSLAQIWSNQVQPVEFGGSPTSRPVSLDLRIIDPKTGERRLKLCKEHFSKWVSEGWFAVRYAIESGQLKSLPQEVAKEGYQKEWKIVRGDKIEIETKAETKERMGRSSDYFDWLVVCVEGARRRGFQISKVGNKTFEAKRKDDWLDRKVDAYQKLQKSRELQFY